MNGSRVARRALCLLLLAVVLATAVTPAFAAQKPSGAYVVSTSKRDRLRVHTSPWGDVKDYLKRGTVVVFKYRKSGWWYVDYRGGSGFVDKSYLTSVAYLSTAKYRSVDSVWVRSAPKLTASILGKLRTKYKVSIIGQKGSWVRIKRGVYTGWVAAKYLRRVS